jgi:hypothetical protein
MHKAESLSIQTVLGLDGCGQSLLNKISIQSCVISTESQCDFKTQHLL